MKNQKVTNVSWLKQGLIFPCLLAMMAFTILAGCAPRKQSVDKPVHHAVKHWPGQSKAKKIPDVGVSRATLIHYLDEQGVVFGQQGEQTILFIPVRVLFMQGGSHFRDVQSITAEILEPIAALVASYQPTEITVSAYPHPQGALAAQRTQALMDALWTLKADVRIATSEGTLANRIDRMRPMIDEPAMVIGFRYHHD